MLLYARIFAPLGGGAEAARKKISELAIPAGRGFSLDSWAQAAGVLQAFTRGPFSAPNELMRRRRRTTEWRRSQRR
jgi:hypothetical protein